MEVFIVQYYNADDNYVKDIWGVYRTEEEAQIGLREVEEEWEENKTYGISVYEI